MIFASLTSSIANGVVNAIGNSLLKGVFSLDSTLASLVYTVFSNLPDPQIGSSWFLRSYYRLAAFSATLVLIAIFVYVIRSLLSREEPLRLGKVISTFASLPVIFVTPTLTVKLFAITNYLVAVAYGAFTTSSKIELISNLMVTSTVNPVLGAVLALSFSVASLTLTIELALRNAFLYFAIAIVPFVAPFYSLRSGRQVIGRLISIVATLEAFKFVVGLGLSLASVTSTKGQLFGVIEGTALIFAVVTSPLLLLRIFFGLEGATLRQIENLPSKLADLSSQRIVSLADAAIGIGGLDFDERSSRSKIPLHRGSDPSVGSGGQK